MLTEQYEPSYFADYYGVAEDELWLIKNDEAVYGAEQAKTEYDALLYQITACDYTDDGLYAFLEDNMVDLDNMIRWFCAMLYLDNDDILPRHNQMLWRTAEASDGAFADGRWRWAFYDLDACCNDPSHNTIEEFQALREEMYLPGALCANEDFRERYQKTMTEMMETVFSYDRVHALLLEWAERYERQTVATNRRFFEASGYTTEDYWADVEALDRFFLERRAYMEQYFAQELGNY